MKIRNARPRLLYLTHNNIQRTRDKMLVFQENIFPGDWGESRILNYAVPAQWILEGAQLPINELIQRNGKLCEYRDRRSIFSTRK